MAYYSFIRVQEVYTINVQISFIFLHQYSDNKQKPLYETIAASNYRLGS